MLGSVLNSHLVHSMSTQNFRKITLSVPPDLVEGLDYISGRVGVTRSALVTSLMSEPIRDLWDLVSQVPENPSPEDVVRLRGKSQEVVSQRVESLRRLSDDLFSH